MEPSPPGRVEPKYSVVPSHDSDGRVSAANATAVRFAEEESSGLVGYLSGLVAPRGRPARERADVVSDVGGIRTTQAERSIAGFRRGIRSSHPRTRVLVSYSNEAADRTRCEQIANAQIDRGADVVYAMAGRCGSGALAVARSRGVWAAGSPAPEASSDRWMLVRTYKEYQWGIDIPLYRFLNRTLPAGRDLVLGLADDYAVAFLGTSDDVPPAAMSKTVEHCSSIRRTQGGMR